MVRFGEQATALDVGSYRCKLHELLQTCHILAFGYHRILPFWVRLPPHTRGLILFDNQVFKPHTRSRFLPGMARWRSCGLHFLGEGQ